jgi:acyl-CoA dehydrogenase
MGFVEETGAAQYVRDVRITTIYEGTTGIQSNDLIGRKLGRDRGASMTALLTDIRRDLQAIDTTEAPVAQTRDAVVRSVTLLEGATRSLLQAMAADPASGFAVSVPYLKLCGVVVGGWLLAKSAALAAAGLGGADRAFYQAKIRTAYFYARQVLPRALGLAQVVQEGADSVLETGADLV